MRWLYTSLIFAYVFAIRIAALTGNRKAKLWVNGRKDLFQQYRLLFMHEDARSFFWFHVSSLGEFEQGRPVIESIRTAFPEKKILLTFFSPSGYEVRKNYSGADYVLYLPFDCLRLMRKFVAVVKPAAVIFVKYDFWFNFITACKEKNIPVFFISSVFRSEQYFFRWWAGWFRNQLKNVERFFVQNAASVDLLHKYGITKASFAGDTRLDRVIAIREEQKVFPDIEHFINGRKVLLAGSTWQDDEKFLLPWIKEHPEICFLIAPHDISEFRLNEIEKSFGNDVVRLSQLKNESQPGKRILLIDSIGVLAYLYRYAVVAYIGNGFGKGIHNILEAIVYGKPAVFGPNFGKFSEAVTLVKNGGTFTFSEGTQFDDILNKLFWDEQFCNSASEICLKYVNEHSGATAQIIDELSLFMKREKL